MNCFKNAVYVAALALIATAGFAGSAQAISFKMTTGVAGPKGVTNQGAFSEFAGQDGVVTVDFNSGSAPTSGFAKYSFTGSSSSVKADMWAPVGAAGEQNTSNYLAVFAGSDVVINLDTTLNYFGIDWGAAHSNNIYSFYRGNSLVKAFSTADIDAAGGFALYSSLHPGGNEAGAQKQKDGSYAQGNGYVHFYSESADDIFDKIVISQWGGGGFETDNHSFHAGTGAFSPEETESVPEPGLAVGLLAMGGLFALKRNSRKKNQEALQG